MDCSCIASDTPRVNVRMCWAVRIKRCDTSRACNDTGNREGLRIGEKVSRVSRVPRHPFFFAADFLVDGFTVLLQQIKSNSPDLGISPI